MHDATQLPAKLYFRIGEVADLVGVEPHVLRYWEREFRSIRPSKSAKGQRVYSRRDVENLMRVRELLYTQGFTIAGAKKRLQRTGAEPTEKPDEGPPKSPANDVQSAAPALDAPPTLALALALAPHAPPPPPPDPTPTTSLMSREHLKAMRAEIVAFLDELGG